MAKSALLLIDIQNDYFASENGKAPCFEMELAAKKAAELLVAARKNGETVIHIRHEIPSEEAPFFAPSSEGANIHSSVAPVEGEKTITKNAPNCFLSTDLEETLRQAGIENLTIAGAMSHMCIDAGARAAADMGFKCTIIADACATRDLEFDGQTIAAATVHASFMAALAQGYATITSKDAYLG